jgi:hypothetical protein
MFKILDLELSVVNNQFEKNGDIRPSSSGLLSNLHIVRLLKVQLPSFADQFMCPVPMTRIRDIAHRNDIPKDLKNDIKHNL